MAEFTVVWVMLQVLLTYTASPFFSLYTAGLAIAEL